MKSNSLEDILDVLENPSPESTITLDERTQKLALKCVERMFDFSV